MDTKEIIDALAEEHPRLAAILVAATFIWVGCQQNGHEYPTNVEIEDEDGFHLERLDNHATAEDQEQKLAGMGASFAQKNVLAIRFAAEAFSIVLGPDEEGLTVPAHEHPNRREVLMVNERTADGLTTTVIVPTEGGKLLLHELSVMESRNAKDRMSEAFFKGRKNWQVLLN